MKKVIQIMASLFFVFASHSGFSTHLLGHYFTYTLIKVNGTTSAEYNLKLSVYRDCSQDGSSAEVPFDDSAFLCVYSQSGSLLTQFQIGRPSKSYTNGDNPDNCLTAAYTCIQKAVYESKVTLPYSADGYILQWRRCCRGHDNNLPRDLQDMPVEGMTALARIPSLSIQNSSPALQNDPVVRICYNDSAFWTNKFSDADGDSLSYEIVTPWSGPTQIEPLPVSCSSSFITPQNVLFNTGYSTLELFGSTGVYDIDSSDGEIVMLSKEVGYFSGSIDVLEWRNNNLISKNRMDFTVMVDYALSARGEDHTQIKIYPNPANSVITVNGLNGNSNFVICDAQGRRVLAGYISNHQTIDLAALSSGIYSLTISNSGQEFRQKLVVQK